MLGRDLTWSSDTALQRRGLAKRYPLASALTARDVGTAETNRKRVNFAPPVALAPCLGVAAAQRRVGETQGEIGSSAHDYLPYRILMNREFAREHETLRRFELPKRRKPTQRLVLASELRVHESPI
jgi:hypothetical protein